jgi:hypothetical protein
MGTLSSAPGTLAAGPELAVLMVDVAPPQGSVPGLDDQARATGAALQALPDGAAMDAELPDPLAMLPEIPPATLSDAGPRRMNR